MVVNYLRFVVVHCGKLCIIFVAHCGSFLWHFVSLDMAGQSHTLYMKGLSSSSVIVRICVG